MKISAPCRNCGTPTKSKYGYCWQSPECRRLYKRTESRAAGKTEQRRAYLRGWYVANRERVLVRQKEYQAANPERMREKGARWRAANPDYLRQWRARPGRRCKRKGCDEPAVVGLSYCKPHDNEGSRRRRQRVQDRTAQFLYDRQDGACPDADHGGCGQPLGPPGACHIDHLIPLALNGPDDDWNLQLMHARCNRIKQDRLVPAAAALLCRDQ